MDKKKDILLDVDEVVCFSGFLPAVNDFFGTHYEIDDFTEYYIDEAAIPKEKFAEREVIRAGYDWHDGWSEVDIILLQKDKTKAKKKTN